MHKAYQLLSNKKTLKEIQKELDVSKQKLNYYIKPLKELGYIEKIGYAVWEIKKKWDQKEVDKFLKQVKKTTRIGINQLEEIKDLKEVRGHAVQIKLELPKNYRNWENRRKIFDLVGLDYKDHFIGGMLRGEKAEMDKIKIHFYHKTIVINLDEKNFFAETSKKSKSYALKEFLKIIKKLERMFNNSPLSQFGKYKFKITRQHYALIKNALARQYINENKKLEVYTARGLWLLIDDSFGLEELETIHTDSAVEDNEKIQTNFNQIKETPLEVLKELKPIIIKEKLDNHDKMIEKSITAIGAYTKQINLHLKVEEEQLVTQKKIQEVLGKMEKKL